MQCILFLGCLCLGMLGTTAFAAHPQPLRWAVLLDLNRSSVTPDGFTAALRKHITTMTTVGRELFSNDPTVINSNGDLIVALVGINTLLAGGPTSSSYPDVIFLAETTDVSSAVVDVLRQDVSAAGILLVSAHSSNQRLCDADMNPRTMCMVPRDMLNLRGVLEVVSSQLNWDAMGVVYSNTGYGDGVKSAMSSQVSSAVTTPTIVAEEFMNPETSDAEDDAIVQQLVKRRAKGVACFLDESQMKRLRAAVQRAGMENSFFLLGSREALNVLPLMVGSYHPLGQAWGALLVSTYTTVDLLLSRGLFLSGAVDEFGAFITSHVFDGMTMIEKAGGTSSMSTLRSVRFTGYTSNVAFDPVYYQRVECTFQVILLEYPATKPLLTWYLQSYSATPVITNNNPTITSALIPTSPLLSVTVCMASPATCGDVQMMAALSFVLMMYNYNNSDNGTKPAFLPIAINTGKTGVAGLAALIPVARTCTVLTGPGRPNIAIALTPVINEFKIPQLDYSTAIDFFTKELYTYPHFSRTTPAISFIYTAYSEVCAHFAWERVIIVSTEDQLGSSRASAMSNAMERRNIYVEKSYMMKDASEASIITTFQTIYARDVSRVIVILLPLALTEAETFYSLVQGKLPFLNNYIFLLSHELCMHATTYPDQRKLLQSSICVLPSVPQARLDLINTQVQSHTEIQNEIRVILTNGKMLSRSDTCNLQHVQSFMGFAVDAGYVLIDVVERALAANISLNESSQLVAFIRNTSFDKFSGPLTIDSTGNRIFAEFDVNIQLPENVLTIGRWSELMHPSFIKLYTTPFLWMTNSTTTPLDTFRDYSFILGTSVSASPGAIVLSLLGFVVTIVVFFFCYRHYRVQKLIELTLVSNDVPVTEEELKRLRGDIDDI